MELVPCTGLYAKRERKRVGSLPGDPRNMDTGTWLHAVTLCAHGAGLLSWQQALRNRTKVWLERVASDDNIADEPSRDEYGLMNLLGARWRPPVVAQFVVDGMPWAPDGPVAVEDVSM